MNFKAVRILTISTVIFTITVALASFFYRFKRSIFIQGQVVSSSPSLFIKSEINAPVSTIHIKAGDNVEPGQLLISFDCEDLDHRVRGLKEQNEYLKSALITTTSNFKNSLNSLNLTEKNLNDYIDVYSKLAQSGSVASLTLMDYKTKLSQIEIEKSIKIADHDLRVQQLKADLVQNSTELEPALRQSKKCNLRAPDSGIISDISVQPGELIQRGSPLLRIFRSASISLAFNLLPKDFPLISVGDKFTVRVTSYRYDKYGDIEAVVDSISPTTKDLILDPEKNNSSSQQSSQSSQPTNNSYTLRALIVRDFEKKRNLNLPTVRSGMSVTGIFSSDETSLISLFSDQFVKIERSVKSLRSRF